MIGDYERDDRRYDHFVNLHCHSYFSLLDGLSNPQDIVDYTLELGQPAASVSDHGVMYGLVNFVQYAQKKGQYPIIAMEAYVVNDHKQKGRQESDTENTNTREHLLLIATNEIGYKNLMRLASIAATEGFYYRPRIDDNLLSRYNEGLIATSTCLGSRFSQLIMRGDTEGCKREIEKYLGMFPGRFYLEIQPTKEYFQKIVNHTLIKISREMGIPLVATTDAHYLRRSDAEAHGVLLTIQSNDTLDNPFRWQFPGDTFFVASRREMIDMFEEECESELDERLLNRDPSEWLIDSDDTIVTKTINYVDQKTGKPTSITKRYVRFKHNIPRELIESACDNTVVIAKACNFELRFDKLYLPKIKIPDDDQFERWYQGKIKRMKENERKFTREDYYLRYLCIKGLKEKGKTDKRYRDRLEYELNVITSMGFSDYFLLLENVVNWSRKNSIPVGPGRGCIVPGQDVWVGDRNRKGLYPKKIENVRIGDLVLTHRGNLREVKGVQEYEANEEIVVIEFKELDGSSKTIRLTRDHELFVIPKRYERDFKNVRWVMAEGLGVGDTLLLPRERDLAHEHACRGYEECVNCFGKRDPWFIEESNKTFHETVFDANRMIEKTLTLMRERINDPEKSAILKRVDESLTLIQETFGFNETVNSDMDIERFSSLMFDMGYEIATVERIDFEPYEGKVYDLMVEGDTSYTVNGLAVHNSAAGSLVSYAIGITSVDPIEYGLLFERFLNPKRGKLPDIDIDFCIENRDRVIRYVMDTFGHEHTANIMTFGRLQTKAVIKDVAKVMSIPFEDVNAFTKLIPSSNVHVNEIRDIPECKPFVEKYPRLFEYAAKLEGSPRHVSQHAAGIVVTPPEYPIWSLIPIQRGKELDGMTGYLTQLEKGPVETLGILKCDLLGLKNLSELKKQFTMVKDLYNVNLDFNSIPLNDKKSWDLIGSGNTLGVFQFASQLAINVVTKIKPQNIEELSAANAFIRPGASGLDEYVIAKSNPNKRRRLHPRLDPILEATYGAIVYQEQIMALIAEVMGIDFGEADQYRRMLEKAGKFPKEVTAWREEFKHLGLQNGFDERLIDLLAQLIIDNSGYGFNKSHAVCYSIVSYWTAYMKANYPLVFYTVMLNGNLDEANAFITEARRMGIDILPPHVNHSKYGFEPAGENTIRTGFNVIKGVGPRAVESILRNQPFKSIDDYFERNDRAAINKTVVTSLIKMGTFEGLGIRVGENDIPNELNDRFKFETIGDERYVVLSRNQQERWYELLNDINNTKSISNYLIPTNMIAGKYFDTYELIEEKEGGIVVPEDRLGDLGLNPSDLSEAYKTRKKPKGSLKSDRLMNVPPLRRPIVVYHRELSEIRESYFDTYLREVQELGFSFLPHPLEKHVDKINPYDEVNDGQPMVTAGIVTDIIQRPTRNKNKYMYWVILKTPRDSVRVTVWQEQYERYRKSLFKNSLIVVKGIKGYGGMGVEVLKDLNELR